MKIILTYHSVADTPLSVTPNNFKRQMEYLAKNRSLEVVPLQQLFKSKTPQISITFDDCFLDCYFNAVPVLLSCGFSATFFSVPGYDGKILWGSEKFQRWSSNPDQNFNIPYKFMSSYHRTQLQFLGFEIGAHTMTHRNLDELNIEEQASEIFNSIKFLESEGNKKIESFCFPRGKYNHETLQIIKNTNTPLICCTTKTGYATNQILPERFGISNNFFRFKSIIRGDAGKLTLIERLLNKISYD